MTKIDDVYKYILNEPRIENVLKKYLVNKYDRDEFRQELWLIIMQYDKDKLIKQYDNKTLLFFLTRIIMNQICSSTSPWHLKYRMKQRELDNPNSLVHLETIDDLNDITENKTLLENKMNYVEESLKEIQEQNPVLVRDITLFKMYFYDNLSYRQIGKKTNINHQAVHTYVKNIINKIKYN